MKYILNGHEPVACPDLVEWARWMKANKYQPRSLNSEGMDPCRVGSTRILDKGGEAVWVSTVFLGIDHAFTDKVPPILFETLVFGGDLGGEIERYATWEEAEAGHNAMVARVTGVEPRATA